MSLLARVVSGRRSKYLVLGAWLLALVAAGPLAAEFESKQRNEPSSFLPRSAESVAVLEAAREFPSGQATAAIVVFSRPGGLTPADRKAIDDVQAQLNAAATEGLKGVGPPRYSADRTAAILVAPIVAKGADEVLLDAVDSIGQTASDGVPPGLDVKVTGPAGYSAAGSEAFEGINSTLLFTTALLVFVLLVIIYRSPIFWVIPLLAVLFAESLVRGLGTLLAEAGIVINGQTGGILLVLVFGAGTDYALLLTARYREELHGHEDKHHAMRIAIRQAGPGIVASAGTVVAALLCLALASVNSTAGLGPVGAMGVAIAALAMLTVLPAMLLIGGRRAFWPFVPRLGDPVEDGREVSWRRGSWSKLGTWIERRHRAVWIAATLALLALALGTLTLDSNLTTANAFRGEIEAVEGQRLLERSFPAGASAPTTVLVTNPEFAEAVRSAAAAASETAFVGPIETGPPGARFEVTLTEDPFSQAGFAAIEPLRAQLRAVGSDAVLVGGATAEEFDLRAAVRRDTLFLVPLVLVVVLAILVLLLRAVVAPVMLMATVVLSFFAALGLSLLVFELFADFPGEDPSYPLFAFIFLVALGVDYNIFLMARVREEALTKPTRQAMLKGLAVTGGVITSAGVVLAGTFSVLAVLPLVALTQIGITVALGVLLDTFVVRSILVPSLTFSLGERSWWPSALAKRARS
ncbi:MAG: MMPL family transporter [Thermoleophilia bacterium]|nr:MMPL family transporter [Thermoleophilia bacterium]MDH5280213.1 MMPL family transporter [Thermoleophilia bacterium]